MRTKTLLLTAALSAAAIATSVAQTVYSVNAVGYVNVTVPAGGFALLANPLNQPTNTIPAVLPDVAPNTVVYVYDVQAGFSQATKRSTGAWTGPAAAALLNPGQGFFIKNPSTTDAATVTFVGEVPQGTGLTVPIPVGISLLGSIIPQQGKVETDLKIPAVSGDVLYQWDPATQGYKTAATRRTNPGQWTGPSTGEPTIAVAEGFFYQAKAASSWKRDFSVNQ